MLAPGTGQRLWFESLGGWSR